MLRCGDTENVAKFVKVGIRPHQQPFAAVCAVDDGNGALGTHAQTADFDNTGCGFAALFERKMLSYRLGQPLIPFGTKTAVQLF